jgi:serine/threonine-protein kinase
VLGEQVGHGGPLTVHRAHDRRLDRVVALKLLRDAGDPERARRLLAEAAVIARLSHPNIVALRDYGTLPEGGAFLAVEWVDGPTLAAVLTERGTLPPADVVELGCALAAALEHAHDAGVLHRDVKPENVIVPRHDGVPDLAAAMLVDFGVHGLLTERAPDGQMTTTAGLVTGSPAWMAPEQLLGARNTAATDLFGLGAVLFAALFGRPPSYDSPQSVIIRRLTQPVDIPTFPDTPAAFRALLARLLDREPTLRPQTAAEVLSALRAVQPAFSPFTRAFRVVTLPSDAPSFGGLAQAPAAAGPGEYTPMIRPAPQRELSVTAELPNAQARGAGAAPRASPPARTPLVLATTVTLGAAGALVFLLLYVPSVAHAIPRDVPATLLRVLATLAAGAGTFAALTWLIGRRRSALAAQTSDVAHSVEAALLGGMPLDREGISRTIVTTVDAIILRCRSLDERLIGQTIVAIAREYASDTSTPASRLDALVQIPQQLERLSQKIAARSTPWYVRHEKLLAAAVSGTAIFGGLAKTLADVLTTVRPTH